MCWNIKNILEIHSNFKIRAVTTLKTDSSRKIVSEIGQHNDGTSNEKREGQNERVFVALESDKENKIWWKLLRANLNLIK